MNDSFRPEPDIDPDVVVVGGGVGGLVAARALSAAGQRVVLIEGGGRLGGNVASHTVSGIRLDSGAESFATRGGTVSALLGELGLTDDIVQPNPAGAWVQLPDRAIPLPRTGLLGIPSRPRDPELRPALGRLGVARAALDLVLPAGIGARAGSLGALVRARMGRRVVDTLVAPIVLGVHSAHPDDVDADAVAPGLRAALRTRGSLAASVAQLRALAPAGSAVGGIAGGMHRLVEALRIDLERRGVRILIGTPVTAMRRHRDRDGAVTGDDWHIDLADGRTFDPARLVLAIPPEAIRTIVGAAIPERLAKWPQATAVELVTIVIDAAAASALRVALDSAPRGTGVLVAEGTPGVRAKALTHLTAKWPWLAHAAGGMHVLRLSYGRAQDREGTRGGGDARGTAALSDGDLRRLAITDAAALLDIPLDEDAVAGFARTTWTSAVPYAARGQRQRIDMVREEVAENPGLEVTGAWIAGTGLAAVVADAQAAAARVLGGS